MLANQFTRALTTRKAFFFLCVAAVALGCLTVILMLPLSYLIDHYALVGFVLAFSGWIVGVGFALPYFSVSVPEVTGLLTVNVLTGSMDTYGTGFHFRYPWEQVKQGNYINLRVMRTDEVRQTFPCNDGPEVIAQWSSQYRSTAAKLRTYIGVDEETINKGLNEVTSSLLREEIRATPAGAVRDGAVKQDLETKIRDRFAEQTVPVEKPDGTPETNPDGSPKMISLEEFYGIDIMVVALSDLDFEADYQKARASTQVVSELKGAAENIVRSTGDGSISSKDALDTVMMIAGKGVTKRVTQDTKLFDVSPGLAESVVKIAEAFSKKST